MASPLRHRWILAVLLPTLAALVTLAAFGEPASADNAPAKGKRTPTPTATRTSTPPPTWTLAPTRTSTPPPTSTSTPAPTDTAVPTDTPTPTVMANATEHATLTASPTLTPTAPASSTPTALASESPTGTPATSPTATAPASVTAMPTATPTLAPLPTTVVSAQAVTYQLNAAHNGATQQSAMQPPFSQRWRRDLGNSVSYPVIAQGMVYVTVKNGSGYGTSLYALDGTSGATVWGPVDLGGLYWWSALAYDSGTLFTVTYSGAVRAFDATSGAPRWAVQLTGQTAFTSAPTVAQGLLFLSGAGSGGTLYALDTATGSVRWTAPVVNGDESAPVVVGDAVFVAYACPNVYRFDRVTGTPQWVYASGCSGAGGKTAAYYNQRLYVRVVGGAGIIFDAQTGQVVGQFQSTTAPALDNQRGFFSDGTTLTARDLGTLAPLWTYSPGDPLTSAPIIVNQVVLAGTTSGTLTALDVATGAPVWSTSVGAPIPSPDEQNVSQPLTGVGVGEGLLVVPAGTGLVAYTAG